MDVEMPALYCPVPFAVHPRAEEITQESLEWGEHFGIWPADRFRRMAHRSIYPWYVCAAAPDADEERVLAFAKFCLLHGTTGEHWPLHWAGQPGRLADFLARVSYTLEVPESKVLNDHPSFMAAMEDLVPQLRALATPVQFRRWLKEVSSCWLSTIRESWISTGGVTLSVNDYLPMRTQTMMISPYFFSGDIIYGREVPDHLFDRPDVRALHQLVLVHIGVRNDVMGYRRDASDGQCNFVPFFTRETGCSEAEVVRRSAGILDSVMHRCVQLARHIEEKNVPDVLREHVADALGATRTVMAYEQHVRHLWYGYEGDMAQHFAEVPSSTEPLPYPSVAWCWNL